MNNRLFHTSLAIFTLLCTGGTQAYDVATHAVITTRAYNEAAFSKNSLFFT
jgi:hypothetical protein